MIVFILLKELKILFYVILVDKVVIKYMGEILVKFCLIFDFIFKNIGVYLFDEFDVIGVERIWDNEVGEMWRVLNVFL